MKRNTITKLGIKMNNQWSGERLKELWVYYGLAERFVCGYFYTSSSW